MDPVTPPARWFQDRFLRCSVSLYLLATATLVLLPMPRLKWHYVYVLDDPAIHLSLAENLLHHGTWGVTAGHYQSASSAPAWTALLAVLLLPFGWARDYVPLLANIACGVGVLAVLAHVGTPLRPAWRRPVHVLATAMLVMFVLFLPGLAVVGMEHSLHCLLVVVVVLAFEKRWRGNAAWGPPWLPYLLLSVAVLTRFETAFVALGIGLGILLRGVGPWAEPRASSIAARLRAIVLVGVATAGPLVGFALVNHLMGQGLLPNSVLYKSQLTGVETPPLFDLTALVNRAFQDPFLAVFWAAALLYLAACRPGRSANVVQATVLAVAVPLHVVLAQVGWYERYQSYLIVLGVVFFCSVANEILPARRDVASDARTGVDETGPAPVDQPLAEQPLAGRPVAGRLAVVALLAAIPFAHYKIMWTWKAPGSSFDMYQQHVLAGQFLGKYYDGKPIATGELGYISLLHRGGITDLNGLGDYDVLRARQEKRVTPQYWSDLSRARGFDVVAVYPLTLGFDVPRNWILVGTWVSDGPLFTAIDTRFQFWATTPEAVAPLQTNLTAFASHLPPNEHLVLDKLAQYRAAVIAKGG